MPQRAARRHVVRHLPGRRRRGDARREGGDDEARVHQTLAQRHGHRFDRPGVRGGGADGICLINTLLGMRIDVARRRPVIANTMGRILGRRGLPRGRADGLSGSPKRAGFPSWDAAASRRPAT